MVGEHEDGPGWPPVPECASANLVNSSPRQIYAVTYGEPPDPPASTALIQAMHDSA